MVQLSKSELIPLLVSHFRQQIGESAYQMYALSQKYDCAFDEFEQIIQTKKEEDLEAWDDYISWKGHLKSAQYLSSNIKKIEDGLFTLA